MFARLKLIVLLLSTSILLYGLLGGLMDKVSARDDAYRDLSLFTDVVNKIRNDYVEDPDLQKALGGALHGMLEALDPYSGYIDAGTYKELSDRSANLGSPGIVVSKRYGYAYIVAVHEESPAHEQGLRTGDLVETIDG